MRPSADVESGTASGESGGRTGYTNMAPIFIINENIRISLKPVAEPGGLRWLQPPSPNS